MDTYRYFADWPALVQYLRIYNSRTGKTSSVNNLSLYVQPYFFDGVISDITTNLTDREFVQEVVTIKNQIIVESSSLGDHYHWSAETLTEGVGTSGDIAILMMSLLKSGNNQSQYGLQVSMVYCDVQNLTNPQNVNHVMVEVRYIDGTVVILDTTTNASYIENQVDGWKYLV